MDPLQVALAVAVVIGVVWLDRRIRRSAGVVAGTSAPWTAARLGGPLVKVTIGIALIAVLLLILQAARIEIGWLGQGPGGT